MGSNREEEVDGGVGWSLVNLSFSFRTPSTSSYLLFIFFLLVSCLFAKKKKNKHPKKQERRRRRQKTTNRGNENEWSVGCFLIIFHQPPAVSSCNNWFRTYLSFQNLF